MKKKQKKQSKYILHNKEFTTFKEMKTYAYFNMGVGTKEEALEIYEDQIMKKYELIKQKSELLKNINYVNINTRKYKIFHNILLIHLPIPLLRIYFKW